MNDRAFAVVSDQEYFPGLWALLNSIYRYHVDDIPIFIFPHDLTDSQLASLDTHPLPTHLFPTQELTFPSAGTWEAKQQVFAFLMDKVRYAMLLDADLVLTTTMVDVFEHAQTGQIVSSNDGEFIKFSGKHSRYSRRLPGSKAPYLNSGALCLDIQRHWDLVGLWAYSSQYAAYSPNRGRPLQLQGHGDQGTFNAVACMLGKKEFYHVLPAQEWCDSGLEGLPRIVGSLEQENPPEIVNEVTGKPQRLLHCTGQKWWTSAGRDEQAQLGDKLKIFDFFFELLPLDGK